MFRLVLKAAAASTKASARSSITRHCPALCISDKRNVSFKIWARSQPVVKLSDSEEAEVKSEGVVAKNDLKSTSDMSPELLDKLQTNEGMEEVFERASPTDLTNILSNQEKEVGKFREFLMTKTKWYSGLESEFVDFDYDLDHDYYFQCLLQADGVDGWDMRQIMNDAINSDFVPNTDTVISGLYLARKLNEFSVAVRWLESVRLQLRYCPGNKNYDGVTWEEFEDEIAHVLEELGIPRLSEMGYDKPELATNDSEVWHHNYIIEADTPAKIARDELAIKDREKIIEYKRRLGLMPETVPAPAPAAHH